MNTDNLENNYLDIFASKGLSTLGLALSFSLESDFKKLVNKIEDDLEISIDNPKLDSILTSEDIERLRDFEDKNQELLNKIINKAKFNLHTADNNKPLVFRRSVFLKILSLILILFSLIYIICITWLPIPESNQRFADTCLGFILGTIIASIINHFFSSGITTNNYNNDSNNTN